MRANSNDARQMYIEHILTDEIEEIFLVRTIGNNVNNNNYDQNSKMIDSKKVKNNKKVDEPKNRDGRMPKEGEE